MRKIALKILSVYLKSKGFKKKGQVWYLLNLKGTVALMIEYQGSYISLIKEDNGATL